jgi:hypothetical protein
VTEDEEAGTLVAEAAIFTPIIAFTHVVEVESSLNFLFKWIVPILIYFLYLLRVFSRRKGEVEKSNTLIPYISSLSEIGIIYVLYGLTSDFFTLTVALTAVIVVAVALLLIIEIWIGGFRNFSEFAANKFEERADAGTSIPFLENMAYMSQNINPSQNTNEVNSQGSFLKAIVTLTTMLVIFCTLISGSIYILLWFFAVNVKFLTVLTASIPLLFLKTIISYLYSDDGYGSVDYFDIMSPLSLGILSLTLNIYLLISLI